MKALKFICCSLLVASALGAEPGAQPLRTDINPALLYYQAYLVAPTPLAQSEWDYLGSIEGHSQKLPDRFGPILAAYNDQFALVRRAAHATAPCDWGVDLSAGMETLLPYLAPAKQTAVMTSLRVTWDLEHNRQAEARDDLLAALTLGRNVSRGGLLIPALVQSAIEAIISYGVVENFGKFSPETLQQLLEGIDKLPARGTMAECVATETMFFENWLRDGVRELQQANPGDDAKVMAGIQQMLARRFDLRSRAGLGSDSESDEANWWGRLTQAAGGTSEGITNLIRDLEPFSRKMAGVLRLPYREYQRQIQQLKTEAQQSPDPLVLLLNFPAWERVRAKEFRALVTLAMVRAGLEYKLHGEAGLQSITDPCGQGPFAFRRFAFQGVDRGFELRSANDTYSFPLVLIFVEKEGPSFYSDGPYAGQPRK